MQFDDALDIIGELSVRLRYGENPHQEAALYIDPSVDRPSVARAKQLQGKALSFNNIADADAAFECVAEFSEPAAVIVKHMNPCGVAISPNLKNQQGDALLVLKDTYLRALACDPVSAFGGIVALNRPVDAALAGELTKIFLEVIVAPSFEKDALEVLKTKPNVRLLETGGMPDPTATETTVRSVAGGFLVQTRDSKVLEGEPKVVSKRAPTAQELADMKFAFNVCKHVKSNTVVYAKDGATLGIGAGQMSRIYSAKIATIKAADANPPAGGLSGSVMASDAFMPFPDVVEEAARVGATAIIQPGGSKNEQASIDATHKADIGLVFTGIRHFRH